MNGCPFIEAEKQDSGNVKRACELLKVSRAAFYAHRSGPCQRERADADLASRVRAVHMESRGRYGAPRIHAELWHQGHRHGRKRVARLMRRAGIAGLAAKRWKKTTIADPAAAARADRIRRDFTTDANRLNARWCGDITYIRTWEGWLFLATVIDIASRRVVGYAMADHLRTSLVADALANAVAARHPDPGVIFHSDRGCPVHLRSVRGPGRRLPGPAVAGPHRAVLGQRPRREFLRLTQRRAHRHPALAHPGRRPPGRGRVHRLVQRHPPAQHPRLPQPRRIRGLNRKGAPRPSSLTSHQPCPSKRGNPNALALCSADTGRCPCALPASRAQPWLWFFPGRLALSWSPDRSADHTPDGQAAVIASYPPAPCARTAGNRSPAPGRVLPGHRRRTGPPPPGHSASIRRGFFTVGSPCGTHRASHWTTCPQDLRCPIMLTTIADSP